MAKNLEAEKAAKEGDKPFKEIEKIKPEKEFDKAQRKEIEKIKPEKEFGKYEKLEKRESKEKPELKEVKIEKREVKEFDKDLVKEKDPKELVREKEPIEKAQLEAPPVDELTDLSARAAGAEAAKVSDKQIEKIKAEKEFDKAAQKEIEKIKAEKEFDKIARKEIEKIKPEKELKIEKHEFKELKNEFKERKDKHEKELKNEFKEFSKIEIEKDPSSEVFKGDEAKPIETGLAVDPSEVKGEGTIEERVARLEAAIYQLGHFIGIDLRPDLSAGALKQEADAGVDPSEGQAASVDPSEGEGGGGGARKASKSRRARASKK